MTRPILPTITFIATTALLGACKSTDDPASLIIPNRNQEGLTGPGIRLADSGYVGTNQLDRASNAQYAPTDYLRREQEQPVNGVDFFQYKKKF